jgi:hypothetical protein
MSLGMNDREPCPSRGRLKHHLAHGELCPRCMPDVERTVYCRECRTRVPAVGEFVQPHPIDRFGVTMPCPGEGVRVAFPPPVQVPIWVRPPNLGVRRVIALPSLPAGAA